MNIWLVNQYAVPPDAAGGTRHYGLARALGDLGHRVIVFASTFNHMTRTQRTVGRSSGVGMALERVGGVDFAWIWTPGYAGNGWQRVRDMLAFSFGMLRVSRYSYLLHPDVIVGSSPHPFAAWSARAISKRFGVPFVLEVRDLWPQSLVDVGGIAPHHPFVMMLNIVMRRLYHSADGIVYVTPLMRNHVLTHARKGVPLACIPNGVDLAAVPIVEPPDRSESFVVMYVGYHGHANGLDLLLDAAELLQRTITHPVIRIVLVGEGVEKPRLMQRAGDMGLRNVEFRPPVPKGQVYGVLKEAHAFVVVVPDSPVYRNGASANKFFDYLAMARPTVMAAPPMPRNPFAESGSGIVVPPGNAPALAEGIVTIARMSDDARWAMGLKGRRYVEEEHAFPVLARTYERMLLDLQRRNARG